MFLDKKETKSISNNSNLMIDNSESSGMFDFFTRKLPKKNNFTKTDFEYMKSLSAATLQTQSRKLHWVLIFFAIFIFSFLGWAHFAKIDEITRGSGKVVPSGQNQVLQNLEGGIISEILVKEGDIVEKDQILIRINNERSISSVAASELKQVSLQAKIDRLLSETNGTPFQTSLERNKVTKEFIDNEKKIYDLNKDQFNSQISVLTEQMNQKQQRLKDSIQTKDSLKSSHEFIRKEIEMTEPMVKRGIRSQVDFLKLQREENDSLQKLNSADISIKRTQSEIKEIKSKIKEAKEVFKIKASQEYNKAIDELKEIEVSVVAFEDQVSRTVIKSPSNGIVQKLHVNTIGGSVKPAQDLVEIVPTDFNLVIEAKVLPADIAFLFLGQKAIVKISAYDFAIFGGLEGKVVSISPDTITDAKDEQTYYLVRIQTDKNFLGSEKNPKEIIPGMVANVDILTGKKSVLDYILKPFLKVKQYSFSER